MLLRHAPSGDKGARRVTDDLNPQAKEMADESMVRNLAAQADAIWPQEQLLFDRYQLPFERHGSSMPVVERVRSPGAWRTCCLTRSCSAST